MENIKITNVVDGTKRDLSDYVKLANERDFINWKDAKALINKIKELAAENELLKNRIEDLEEQPRGIDKIDWV